MPLTRIEFYTPDGVLDEHLTIEIQGQDARALGFRSGGKVLITMHGNCYEIDKVIADADIDVVRATLVGTSNENADASGQKH